MESKEDYALRSKDEDAKLPKRPSIPNRPTDTTDSVAYHIYVDKRKEYKAYREYNQQTLDLIKETFPDSLLLMKDEDFLPPGTATFDAMKHIKNAVRDNLASREYLTKLVRSMPDKGYVPNNNGPHDYFAGIDADIRMPHKLGHITDLRTVILFAQSAFTHAHQGSAVDIRKVDKGVQCEGEGYHRH